MPTLRVYLLGGLRLVLGETPLPPFPTQKTRSLFAYLATFRERPHRRAALAEVLWPETPAARAGRSLNTTLWRLRRALPPDHIAAAGDRLALAPTADRWVDAAAFEALLDEAGLDAGRPLPPAPLPAAALNAVLQAVELYHGDLLAGLEETWSLVEAERLRSRYLDALQRLLAHYRARGEPETALDYAHRLLHADPLREEAHRQAMELYLTLGRRGEALAQFERCRQLLREELAAGPLPETTALYERIRAGGQPFPEPAALPAPSRPPPLPRTPFDDLGRVPLVGRAREWGAVQARIEAAGRGEGGFLLIQGPAGSGKTRILQEAVRFAEGRGWLVLRGACRELRQPPPYQGWNEALRPTPQGLGRQHLLHIAPQKLAELSVLVPELRHLFPALPPPDPTPPHQGPNRVVRAIRAVLADLALLRPCLVVLEDLHWVDAAGLDTLQEVVQQADGAPLLCIGTARPPTAASPLRAALLRLASCPGFQQVTLPRLAWNETARLVGETLGWNSPDPLFTARLYQETRGNPLFVIEVLKGLFERGLLAWNVSQQWDVSRLTRAGSEMEWPLSRGWRQAVQQRLDRLEGRSQQLLELIAVLGGEGEPAVLRHASGWKSRYFQETADDLLRRQLLVESDDHLYLVHDVFQQVLYRGVPAARRRALHRRAGETLEKLALERVEELAHHFVLARQPGRALPYCLLAGQRAVQLYALQPALVYYSWAIESAQEVAGVAGRQALLAAHEARGKILSILCDSDSALADFAAMEEAAVALGDGAARSRAVRRAAWLRGDLRGEWEEALRGTRRAYQLAVQSGSKREMAVSLLDVGACLSMCGELAPALAALQGALALADETADSGARAAALEYMVLPHDLLGNHAAGVAAAQEALTIWRARGDRRQAASATLIDAGFLQLRWGDLEKAAHSMYQADDQIKDTGVQAGFLPRWIGLAAVQCCQGETAAGLQALAKAEAAIGEGSLGPNLHTRAMLYTERGRLRWAGGRLGAALHDLQQALALARASGARPLVAEILDSLGGCLQALGLVEQSFACYHESLDLAARMGLARGQAISLAGLGLAEVARGQIDGGLGHLRQAVRQARRSGPRSQGETMAALAAGCLAVWALAPARALAARALALAEQMALRPLQVQALLVLGQAMAGQGRRPEAEGALRRALALADPPGYPLARWEILLALGHLLAEAGRPADAQFFYEQARSAAAAILAELDEPARTAFHRRPAVHTLLEDPSPPLAPGQTHQTLARLGAPTGRPLRPAEQVVVAWTIPPTPTGPDKVAARRAHLLRLVNEARAQGGDPGEHDLAQTLGVSLRTVRADIAALRAAGRPVRTRGTRKPGAARAKPGRCA